MTNTNLIKAGNTKNDEFYTQLADIENELKHYKEQFRGKVVFLNCDDPFESNFFKYFAANFKHLGLKRLITTSYKPSPIANTQIGLFGDDKTIKPAKGRPKITANKFVINDVGDIDGDGAFTLQDIAEQLRANKNNEWTPLDGDGDFRGDECIELLKEADIVCTNPPFSLFREYVAQLIEYDKKFLIIGNKNAPSYKEVFSFIQENKLWIGYTAPKDFFIPGGQLSKKLTGLTRWFTNMDIAKRHQKLDLYRKYSPELYPTYANFDAIEVGKVSDIPMDYDGMMGVPITFLDKYNPEQFEIIGSSRNLSQPIQTPNGLISRYKDRNGYMRQAANERFALPDGDTWRQLYDRIVIKRKVVK